MVVIKVGSCGTATANLVNMTSTDIVDIGYIGNVENIITAIQSLSLLQYNIYCNTISTAIQSLESPTLPATKCLALLQALHRQSSHHHQPTNHRLTCVEVA